MCSGARRHHKLTAVLFVSAIGFLLFASMFNGIYRYVTRRAESSEIAQLLDEQNPVPDGMRKVERGGGEACQSGITQVVHSLYYYRDLVEDQVKRRMWGRLGFVDLFGAVQRALGKEVVETPEFCIYRDSDEKLHFTNFLLNAEKTAESTEDIHGLVSRLADLKALTDEQHTPLLFVLVPPRVVEGRTKIPAGIRDRSNGIADEFIGLLEAHNIDFMDLRRDAVRDGLSPGSMDYRTDHHWTVRSAFWCYTKIFDRLKNQYRFEMEEANRDPGNFREIECPYEFLGSIGNRVGRFFVGSDRFSYLTPDFFTRLSVSIEDYRHERRLVSGTFREALLDESMVTAREVDGPINRYAVYHGGDWPEELIINHNKNNYRILLMKDSFALPVAAFLSLNVRELKMIDLRWYRHDMSIRTWIQTSRPDLVLLIYHIGSLSESFFRF